MISTSKEVLGCCKWLHLHFRWSNDAKCHATNRDPNTNGGTHINAMQHGTTNVISTTSATATWHCSNSANFKGTAEWESRFVSSPKLSCIEHS